MMLYRLSYHLLTKRPFIGQVRPRDASTSGIYSSVLQVYNGFPIFATTVAVLKQGIMTTLTEDVNWRHIGVD